MVLRASIVLIAFAVCARALPVTATDHAATRKILDAKYAKISQILKRKDMPALVKMTTPDVVFIDPIDHVHTAKAAAKQFSDLLSMFKSIESVKMKVVKYEFIADEVRANTKTHIVGTLVGRRTSRMVLDLTSKEVWVRYAKDWRIKQMATMTVKPTFSKS